MWLYLDDDVDANLLITLLRQSGHEVISTRMAGTRGAADEVHLAFAQNNGLVVQPANTRDFLGLHDRWTGEGHEHAGILLVYQENNPSRYMTLRKVVRAIDDLKKTNIGLGRTVQNLYFWR